MVIVDDHLALLAVAGASLEFDASGPVATTTGFQFRLARAIADSARSGQLSRELSDPSAALHRVLSPPAHRLIVLDPRASIAEAVDIAVLHRANFLFAELVGAALHYRAAVRVSVGNLGKTWVDVMRTHDIDFRTVEP